MRVMTPTKPSQNSMHNATVSSRALIVAEAARAAAACRRGDWAALFEKMDFAERYGHFIAVTATADSEGDQREWEGLVEAKLRHLVAQLEAEGAVALAHVDPQPQRIDELGCRLVMVNINLFEAGGFWSPSCQTRSVPGSGLPVFNSSFLALYHPRHNREFFRWLVGLSLRGEHKKLDLSGAVKYFRHCVTKSGTERGWMNEGMVLQAEYKRRRQLAALTQ